MNRFVQSISFLLFLTGCASKVWVHPETGEVLSAQDEARCELEAIQIYNQGQQSTILVESETSNSIPPGTSRAAAAGEAIGEAMGEGIERGVEIARLTSLCMRAMGYAQVESSK